MNSFLASTALAACLFAAGASVAPAALASSGPTPQDTQNSAVAKSADKSAPSYDMKAQALLDIEQLQKKFVDLAGAIPADKFTWRPADGVRSISEVFLHISAANYGFPNLLGVAPPGSLDLKNLEKSTTDKAQIIDQLNKSFANAHAAVAAMTNADFAKAMPKLGPDANEGDVVYLMVTHAHEHLGQSIAYARQNGIIPPWTAAAMKKSGQQPD
jgi:uncharacterized damage-inducible protein DinB